jgi:hypothetical protein
MEEQELLHLTLSGYKLGSSFSHRHLQRGGVCIFVCKDLNVKKIDILQNCREKDLEIVELETGASKLIVLSTYRAPTGDFNQFLKKLDNTLKYLYKPTTEFLICGDINTDYLLESSQKKHLSSLLTTYNLSHTVNSATRIQNESSTAIDNIFVDNSRLGSTITLPLINGLSDHDAQLLTINNTHATTKKVSSKQRTRIINSETLTNFQSLLKQETWQSVYQTQVTNNMFNSFLNTFLHILEASFPVTYRNTKEEKKMIGSHKELKYHANVKEVYIPSLRTATI